MVVRIFSQVYRGLWLRAGWPLRVRGVITIDLSGVCIRERRGIFGLLFDYSGECWVCGWLLVVELLVDA